MNTGRTNRGGVKPGCWRERSCAGFSRRTGVLNRGRQAPAVSQRQPLHELAGGLVGGMPVEGHHRRRHARRSSQLRAPSVADGRNLDLVGAPANGLFETMNDHLLVPEGGTSDRSYVSCGGDQAKLIAKPALTSTTRRGQEQSRAKKNYAGRFSTAFARGVHNFSTRVPHRPVQMCCGRCAGRIQWRHT